jgi:cytochrome c
MDRLLMTLLNSLRRPLLAAMLAGNLLLPAVPAQAGDAQRGADLFADNCSDCHSTKEDGGNRKGPNLFGVVGRKTGSVPGFDYSDANKAAGWVWTPERLDAYLAAPKTVIPGTIMKFKGDPDAKEREDIIAYLASLHK